MIWYWGRWYFPFVSGCGPIGWAINIVLAVVYLAMAIAVLLLVGTALLVLVAITWPLWIWLLW